MNQMQSSPLVDATDAVGVRTLTLGAAPAHPLSLAMIQSIHTQLHDAAGDPDVNVVILSAPGHIFCAGHDLKEINRHRAADDHGEAFLHELFDACAQMMQTLATFAKPTIAVVDGIATAAGLQMVASCDLAFASPRAQFCLPGVNNGGFCTTPAVGVSRSIGHKHLMELLLSGENKSADWALNAGLINEVIASDTLYEHAHAFAIKLATRNAGPISAGKAALHAHRDLPLDQAYALATPVMVSHFMDKGRLAAEKTSKFKG
jgi:enoyl-CoA hydratase/carnithine racemase